jgi:DNA (cytosine-5)-methyltransferase 1
MPHLRSGISRNVDTVSAWKREVVEAGNALASIYKSQGDEALQQAFLAVVKRMKKGSPGQRADASLPAGYGTSNDDLMRWLERPDLQALAQHETRRHMPSDLGSIPNQHIDLVFRV